jgi:hypothetical protein
MLSYNDGSGGLATRHVVTLTGDQADSLVNAWEFERRAVGGNVHPSTFSEGTIDDWIGIAPDTSNWSDLAAGYWEAVSILANSKRPSISAPYLYLSRHTLELHLKAVIMFGQEWMRVAPDLPGHHDLAKLWTAAVPIAKATRLKDDSRLRTVGQMVDDYCKVDCGSYSFRYPVSKNNEPIQHQAFLHAFSLEKHAELFQNAVDFLGELIRTLRILILFSKDGLAPQPIGV